MDADRVRASERSRTCRPPPSSAPASSAAPGPSSSRAPAGTCGCTDPSAEALEAAPRLIREALDELAAARPRRRPGGGRGARSRSRRRWRRRVAGVDLVQENGPETRRGQARDLRRARRRWRRRDAILASSTSAIVASRFTEDLRRPRALPRRASRQPAASRADRRALRRALDLAGRDRARARRDLRERRPGADHRATARSTASS